MASFLKVVVNICSAEMQRAAHFYGHVLGLAKTYRFPYEGGLEHIEYQVDEAIGNMRIQSGEMRDPE